MLDQQDLVAIFIEDHLIHELRNIQGNHLGRDRFVPHHILQLHLNLPDSDLVAADLCHHLVGGARGTTVTGARMEPLEPGIR